MAEETKMPKGEVQTQAEREALAEQAAKATAAMIAAQEREAAKAAKR